MLTVRDTVVLALVAEGPTYGYAIEAELRRRDVRDWADLSRPQVYKSLEKMQQLGLIGPSARRTARRGPLAATIAITAAGKRALAQRLASGDWALTRDRPLFLTWLALCSTLPSPAILAGIETRAAFVGAQLRRERATLAAIASDATVTSPFPRAMVTLTIRHFEVELVWLAALRAEL